MKDLRNRQDIQIKKSKRPIMGPMLWPLIRISNSSNASKIAGRNRMKGAASRIGAKGAKA